MRTGIYLISFLSLFFPILCYSAPCPTSCDAQQGCKKEFVIGKKKIDYYSNFSLNKPNSCIKQVIYVVHGTERNAKSRYFAVLNAAKSLGKENNVLIISPFFKTSADEPAANDYYWTNSGWKQGDDSVNSGNQLSSFTVADTILNSIIDSNAFSSLNRISVTGHSAGGQYTQLYALSTANPEKNPSFTYQFLIMNPSNYSYLNDLRLNPTIPNFFEKPTYWDGSSWEMKPEYLFAAGDCPNSYNNYKYGLDKRNTYANSFPSSELIAQYLKRKVYYMLGSLDIDPLDPDLDKSCSAKLQGPYRLKRGENFYNFLNQYFPSHQHTLAVVPDVGHDASKMYGSEIVKSVLFD